MNKDFKGDSSKKKYVKNRSEIALENEIDKYLESQPQNSDPSGLHLLSPKLERERAKVELLDAIRFSEFAQKIDSAFTIISKEGTKYISSENLDLLMDNFAEANDLFEQMDDDESALATYKEILHLNEKTLTSIETIAIGKFQEGNYADCFSGFVLLTTLDPQNEEYWYRMGIAAQKCEDIDAAIKSYEAALTIDPMLIGARIFSIECYILSGLIDKAEAEYEKAIEIVNNQEVSQNWIDLLSKFKSLKSPPYKKN